MRKQVETFVATTTTTATVAHALPPLSQLLCVAICCYCSVAALLLWPSVFWSRALAHTNTSTHADVYRFVIFSLFSRSLRERHCGALNKIGAFVVVVSRAFERVYVCVCVCERETCGQIFPPFFFFIHSCITCTSLLSYLFCYVYTAEVTFKVDKKYAKNFNFGDGNFLFFVTHI